MKTIVLTGGGTAGHCIPHFSILPYLKENFTNVYYIGSKTGIEKKLVSEKNIPYFEIPSVKLKRKFCLDNFLIPFKLLKSVNEAKKILEKLKPNVVFSKGGYVSLPVILASKKLNIPVIIHESDYSMGLTNKISTKYAKKVLTSFDVDFKIKNQEVVGPPLLEELFSVSKEQALNYYNIKTNKPILLITGGSLGAKAINKAILDNLDGLLTKFTIFHIVGKGNLTNINKKDYYQVEFTKMQYAYNLADICISRCGSNTAFELMALKIPTLFIPLPKSESRGDQIDNALYFKSKKLCRVLMQEDINLLKNEIFALYNSKDYYINNLTNSNVKNGNKKIAKILNTF